MAHKVHMVEQLKQENKVLRLELQQIKTLSSSDAFRQIGYTPYKLETSADQGHGRQLAIQPEYAASVETHKKQEGFFMTETHDFGGNQ